MRHISAQRIAIALFYLSTPIASRAKLFASNEMMLLQLTLSLAVLFAAAPRAVLAQSSATALFAPGAQTAYGQKIHISGIPNAGKINDSLYRGAQPKIPALEELRKLGITTVVDLRREAPAVRAREKAEAERLGMRFLSIPIGGFSTPADEQVAEFLSLFSAKSNEKVFVHCHYGDDRTGVFIAAYRMAIDKWPAGQALNEMYFFGFNAFWQRQMKSYIRDFPERLNSSPAFAPFRAPASPSQ
ncbi:MAG: fused DSP-PTPase phosphatase/NAD kinase-like protein [Candidatus Acidiferrum sp.]